MINLSKNTNPYYPNKKILTQLKKNIRKISEYAANYVEVSDNKFLNRYKLTKDNIIITNGTLDAMDIIVRSNKDKTIGMFKPTFWGMKKAAEINGNNIVERQLKISLKYDEKDISELAECADILYLCNSNNPTLNYIEDNKLLKIIKENKKCLFVVDETVLTFNKEFDSKTLLSYIEQFDNLIILVSLSKILGVCGLRVGLMVLAGSQKQKYIDNQLPFTTNVIGATFVENCLSSFCNLTKCRNKIEKNFRYFINNIDKRLINNIIYNSSSFALIELDENVDYQDFNSYLLNHDIKVAAINTYYDLDKSYLRVSAGTKKEYKKLIKIFNKYADKNVNNF